MYSVFVEQLSPLQQPPSAQEKPSQDVAPVCTAPPASIQSFDDALSVQLPSLQQTTSG
jgi:hypothetical protein